MKRILSLVLSFMMLLGIGVLASADADVSDFKISAPSGAPALALAVLAVENPENYTFVAADTITAEFANATADFIIAPLNAGAKLYQMGKSTYKLGAVVSWGNLYFASQRENFTLEDINGAELTLFGENTINSSVALYALEQNGLKPASVNYLAGAANTQSLLLSDENAIVLTAEPALTAAQMKNDKITAYALNDLYREATGNDGFTQAALFIRQETLETRPEGVNAYLELVKESADKCTTDPNAVAEAAVALEILPNVKVALHALPNCAIRYCSALDAKDQIETTANIDLTQFGGAVPADDFYYEAK
ncbi:MAG: ABC transporter substrate-binding protein [Oscillospiraceae bacterium]|nr:ABC transporter substrate-binding protein [Oscillospiraceae bacterium]